MKNFQNLIFRISIVLLLAISYNFTFSQTSVYWRTDGPSDGKWLWGSTCDPAGDGQWFYNVWGGFRQAPDCYGTNNVFFDGNGINTMNLNSRDFAFQALTFTANATASRTVNADAAFRLVLNNISGTPKIENLSTASHIINAPLTFNALSELNPVNGDLSFQDINNNGNELDVWGDNSKNINFNGVISGSGKFVLKQYSLAKFGAINTYTGNTEIDKGELWIETTGDAIANNNIFVGNGGQLANVSKLFLSRTSGGTTFTRNININPGNSSTRFIGSLNTSGTNTFSGSIVRSAAGRPLSIEVVNSGGTLAVTGVINGSDNITKIGAGTFQLGANSTMTGTWLVENGTLLTASFPARINTQPITLGSASTSGTLRFTSTSAATTSIQFNVNAGGGAIYNASTTNFASNTGFSPNGPLTVGAESTGNLTFAGAIGGTQSVIYNSTGTGKVVLGIAMTYTGATRITSGTMETNNANRIANTSNIIMNGGTHSTGATTGYTDVVGTLQLLENSTIRLGGGSNAHTLTFAASNAVSWTSGKTLTITNWSGTPGVSGTSVAGSIIVGSANTHLTAAQLDQITFQGYAPGAVLKSSGELMPRDYIIYYSKGSFAPEVLTNWSLTRDGTGASPANFSTSNKFVVQNTHTMTTALAWTLSGVGTTLQIENGGVLVSSFAVTIPTTGIFQIDNGGLYKHDNVSTYATTIFRTGASIILGNSSTVEINKTNSTMPTLTSFGNLTIDLSADPGSALSFAGNLTTINGNFIIRHTRARQVRMAAASGPTITVSGNFEVHPNADFAIVTGSGNTTLNVDGNVSLIGGTFSLATSTGIGFLVARGQNVTIEAAVTFAGLLPGTSGIYFNRAGSQTLTINHPFSSGSIRNRFYYNTTNVTGLNEVYSGALAQTTIDGTGIAPGIGYSAWPTSGSLLKNFTINNVNGVTLSANRLINTNLALTAGLITPGANTITLATGASYTGGSATSYVNGILNRVYSAVGNSVFPVGKAGVYRPLGFEYTALTGTSTVSVEQIESALTGTLPSNTNLNNSRQWNVSQTGGSAIQYKVTLDPTSDNISGTVVLLKKESGTITSNASTSPNYTNSSTFSTLTGTNNFTLGSTCTVSSNAGSNNTICDGTSLALAANTPTFGTGAWSVSGPSSSTAQFSSVSDPNASFSPLSGGGDYILTWTITNGNCSATSNLTATVNSLSTNPTSATASSTTICIGGSTTLTLNGGSAGTAAAIQWYSASCGGTAVGSGNALSVSPTMTTTYYGRFEGTCNNTTCASVTITVNQLPTASAGSTISTFVGDYETISGASATNGTILWTENGAGNFDEIWFPVGNPTTLTPTYYVDEADWGNTITLTMTVTGLGACIANTATAAVTLNTNNLPGLWHYQCGTTTPFIDEYIYTYAVPGATNYRIRINDGTTSEVRTTNSTVFYFRQFTTAKYNTIYNCDVDAFVGGSWVGYGPVCQVTTPTIPLTKVTTSQCGITLAALNTSIFADAVWGVTDYEFSAFDGVSTQTFQTTNRFFNLTQLASYNFSTSYAVTVRTRTNGVWTGFGASCNVSTPAQVTQIEAAQCGSILTNNSTDIYCANILGTTIYEFRLVNGGTTLTIQKPSRTFKFSQVTGCLPGAMYAVSVRTFTNGSWSTFGPSCNITSASSLSKIISTQCGTTLTDINTDLYADNVVSATQYRFRVTNSDGTVTIDKASRTFKLTQLTNVKYEEVNTIDVNVFVNGAWIGYGATCNVTSPVLPTSKIQTLQCGITVPSIQTVLYADAIYGATQYRFRVNGSFVATKTNRLFKLSEIPGLAINTTYAIDVSVYVNAAWQAYGTSCNVTSPGVLALAVNNNPSEIQEELNTIDSEIAAITNTNDEDRVLEFDASGFPNPFTKEFSIQLNSNSDEDIIIEISDVTGKKLGIYSLKKSDLETTLIGQNFQAGLYHVIIKQGNNSKLLKVIKY